MILLSRLLFAAALAAFFMVPAQAQNQGTVTNHGFAIGNGPGVQGFSSLVCGNAQIAIGQTSAHPLCRTVAGDVTLDNSGNILIGSGKVDNSRLATMAANTTKCNATGGTAAPTDCNASTMRTNLGLVIGTNVEAWDADLDCLAALSSTGVISRTGAGTCSAGALALSGLATGTQDTVIGYFGSTTASAISIPNCSGALTYATATHSFGCGTGGALVPVFSTRTVAAATDLSAFSVIMTQGYSTAGDGGGATFKKVGSSIGFLDVQPVTGTISGGTGYVNGSYTGVLMSNSSGCVAVANVTVSGTAVTAVSLTGLKGSGCVVGSVITTANNNLGGSGSGFTWTVATIGGVIGSFVDSVGNRWQITPDAGNFLNVRQFGAKGDWTASGGDAGATDDATAFTVSQIYAFNFVGTIDAGGPAGTTIVVPKGTYKICGGIITADSSTLQGQGPASSILKQCDSDAATVNFVTICNPSSLKACFAGRLRDIQLFNGTGAANSNISMIYTNNSQQNEILSNVTVYSGKRVCFFGETGYGGAANLVINGLFCTVSSASVNTGVQFTYGAAAISMKNWIVEAGGAASVNGVQITTGGVVELDGGHCENISTCIFVNVTTGSTITRIHSQTGGANCTNLITRQGGSHTNAIVAGVLTPNGCTNTINNAGTATTGNVVADTVF